MKYLGDFQDTGIVRAWFSTADAAGAAVDPSGPFDLADFDVYKDGSDVQRTSTAGFTYTEAVDSNTGVHRISIDLSDDSDAGFYSARSDFALILTPDTETVDGQVIGAIIAQWSIDNRPAEGVIQIVATGTPTDTVIDTDLTSTVTDVYAGRTLIAMSGTRKGEGTRITGYNGTTKELTVTQMTGAVASGDLLDIV